MQAIIDILQQIQAHTHADTDISETAYDDVTEIQEDIAAYIEMLADNTTSCLDELSIHFLPQSTFYALAEKNGYLPAYLAWQKTFETLKDTYTK